MNKKELLELIEKQEAILKEMKIAYEYFRKQMQEYNKYIFKIIEKSNG